MDKCIAFIEKAENRRQNQRGESFMKKHLQRILSLLCILALAFSAVNALAEGQDPAVQYDGRVITVEWQDNNNYDGLRPASLDATLAGQTVTLSEENGWTGEVTVPADTKNEWSFADLKELGYAVTQTAGDVTVVKFHRAMREAIQVSGTVVWDDSENAGNTRPDAVQLMLLADGEPYGEPKDAKTPGWKVTWDNLPAYKPNAENPIVYTVKQLQDPEGYVSSASGMEVKNTLQTGSLNLNVVLDAPEGADLSGLKLAIDGPDPSMKKTLTYADVKSGAVSLGTVLPGAYLIRDTNADTLIEGYMIDSDNSKVADAVYVRSGESSTLEFKYTWKLPEPYDEEANEDYDPFAGVGELTFDILGPDAVTTPLTIHYSDFSDGKYELPNLVPGIYTVVERNAEKLVKYYTLTSNSVTGLAIEVMADGTATAKLFNQYTPAPTPEPDAEFIDIPVTKTWNDNNNADGNRPASVTARLYADGVEVDSHVLTAAENWQFTFVEKPRYQEDNKTEIVYTVGEDAVAMYAATVNGYNIVNDYQPEVTSVSVSKVWDDNNNEQNLRPDSIAMSLSDGQKVVKVVVLSEANGWTATVNNLPTVVNGQNAIYAWNEQQVLSYTLEGVTQQGNLMIFTNRVWERPENPTAGRRPKTRGNTWYVFEDYDTPLGVEVMINHVGDCFD